jgi:hypothetical protein
MVSDFAHPFLTGSGEKVTGGGFFATDRKTP